MNFKTVIVLALAGPSLHDDDAAVPGGYIVSFDATAVPAKHIADAALDVFHCRIAVRELDSFEFYVLDPRQGNKVMDSGDAEPYSFTGTGDVDGPHVAAWKVAAFRVVAKGGREDRDLGTVSVGGVDLKEMADAAVDLLWDARLRSTGFHPFVERAREEPHLSEESVQERQR